MSPPIHVAVIAGATAPVLEMVTGVFKKKGWVVVAREIKTKPNPIDENYIKSLIDKTAVIVESITKKRSALKLSFWYYDHEDFDDCIDALRRSFFPFACQVSIPHQHYKRDVSTSIFVENALPKVDEWIEVVATKIISARSSSPFLLPFRDFRSSMLEKFFWELFDVLKAMNEGEPDAMNKDKMSKWLSIRRSRIRQKHWQKPARSGKKCFHNDRKYAFQPCDPNDPRERLWRDGDARCYLSAWLRFGATIGKLHYDVQPPHGIVSGRFYNCDGTIEDLSNRGYQYVNIFPNDYIEPKKKK